MTIEELFGTLQMSVVAGWRKHLRSAKYGKHMALDEFYKEMPEKVDDLIEAYMGAYGKKIGAFQNILSSSNMNTLKYLQELKKVCKEGYDLLDDNEELEGLLDDIINLINSTLYKVKELSESNMMDLSDFINEALNESHGADLDQRTAERFLGDKFGRDRTLKTTISKSIMALKSLQSEFTSEEYNMLEKLIDNKENEFDGRSHVTLYNKKEYGGADFTLHMNNMPKSIINKLDHAQQIVGTKHGYSANLHTFGNQHTVTIYMYWDEESRIGNSKESGIKLLKYVLDAIKPVFDDILNYRDMDKEQDSLNRRNRK